MTVIITKATPDQAQVFELLGSFVSTVPGLLFRQGQVNRTPEPKDTNYVVGWPIQMPRLATNANAYEDCLFVATAADGVMTVLWFDEPGALPPRTEIFGPSLEPDTRIAEELSPPGDGAQLNAGLLNAFELNGPVTLARYRIEPAQTFGLSYLAAGKQRVTQTAECVVQLDVHGPDAMTNAATLSTLFRDEYAVDFFAARSDAVSPLYVDDPQQMPFTNGEQQYEDRYVVTAHLEVNQTLVLSQQFADRLSITLIDAAALPVA